MNSATRFDLVLTGDDLDQVRAALRLLHSAPGDWQFLPIEQHLLPAGGYRFRARVWTDEGGAGPFVSGDGGILADVTAAFPDLTITGRFSDATGSGRLDGVEKEYDAEADDEEEGDPLDEPDEPLIIWSDTALASETGPFTTQLEAIGALLQRALEASSVGCTFVEDGTATWSVSGLVPAFAGDAIRQLCSELRRLRVPLDTHLERGARSLPVWPISGRPWRQLF